MSNPTVIKTTIIGADKNPYLSLTITHDGGDQTPASWRTSPENLHALADELAKAIAKADSYFNRPHMTRE